MPETLSPSQQILGRFGYPLAAEPTNSELLQCSICTHKYDCDSTLLVPHVLPACGHTYCAGCIGLLIDAARAHGEETFACPYCNAEQSIAGPCPTNWILKQHINCLRSGKVKRKRAIHHPPAQDDDAFACPRHADATAEVLCFDCAELTCIRCAFECAQKQHKCVKADAMLLSAAGGSSASIDAAFEQGKQRVLSRLDENIRQLQAAAAQMSLKLQELCESTKAKEDQEIKSKIQLALAQKDTRGLCQLLQADAAGPAFDVDVQGTSIIV